MKSSVIMMKKDMKFIEEQTLAKISCKICKLSTETVKKTMVYNAYKVYNDAIPDFDKFL